MLNLVLIFVMILYYYVTHRPLQGIKLGVLIILSSGLLGLSYVVPMIFPLFCLFFYLFSHLHFIKEEKLFALLVVILFFLIFMLNLQSSQPIYSILSISLFVTLEYFHHRILKREEDKTVIYQNKLMKQQVDEIEQIYLTMRGWRHDYHNHLQSLKGYLTLKQVDQMRHYLDELEHDLESIDTLYHTGNIQLDAILNSKLAIAENDEIPINCMAQVPGELLVNDIDLCVIVGNLLDNAIESCRKISQPSERFIRIYISVLKQQLYISITNATNESIKKRTGDYFTNKRGDHGHGLRRVDQVVDKYQGYLNRQNEPGVFATEIMLPL